MKLRVVQWFERLSSIIVGSPWFRLPRRVLKVGL